MALAVLRGIKFYKHHDLDLVEYRVEGHNQSPYGNPAFNKALDDVGQTLGYKDRWDYNKACFNTPSEVRQQIRAL